MTTPDDFWTIETGADSAGGVRIPGTSVTLLVAPVNDPDAETAFLGHKLPDGRNAYPFGHAENAERVAEAMNSQITGR